MSFTEFQYSVTPSTLIPFLDYYTSRENHEGDEKEMLAVMVWGGPGVGKTAIIGGIAASRNSRIVALHLPQMDPTDIKGIPMKNEQGGVTWYPSSYYPQQKKIFVADPDQAATVHLLWEYAIDVATYVLDEKGHVLAQRNDPILSDFGKLDCQIQKIGQGEWKASYADLPDGASEVIFVDKAIVFLDELSAAEPSVQTAALQLVLDRRVGEYDIPFGVPVVGAGNREGDGAFVHEMNEALVNRFMHVTLVPSSEDFIEWGMHNDVRPEILGFVKTYPDAIDGDRVDQTDDENEKSNKSNNSNVGAAGNGDYGYCTPRSLQFLSDQYAPLSFFEQMAVVTDETRRLTEAERLRMISFAGVIGRAEASRFVAYLQVMHDLPSIEEIISGNVTEFGTDSNGNPFDASKTFSLLYSIVYGLKKQHQKHYDHDKTPDDQSAAWINARDNILDFITNNYKKEIGAWAANVIFNNLEIRVTQLRSESGLRFAEKFVDVLTQSGRRR